MTKTKGLPDPSNVSLVAGIYMNTIVCLVSYPFLSLVYVLSLSLKRLSSISLHCCCMWELGVESALALILLGFVCELPFLC